MHVPTTTARLCNAIAIVAFAGCTSVQPKHDWTVQDHEGGTRPAQGLTAVPLIVVDERPVPLMNFAPHADPDYEKRRKQETDNRASSAGGGMADGIVRDPRAAVLCVFLLPICAGMVVVAAGTGAAVGALRTGTSAVTEEQAQSLARAVPVDELNKMLGGWA